MVPIVNPRSEYRAKGYYPLRFPELLSEFIKIAKADEKGVLKFVSTWGLLGRSELGKHGMIVNRPEEPDDIEQHVEHFTSSGPPGSTPESIDWIVAHARTVRAGFNIIRALRIALDRNDPSLLWNQLMQETEDTNPEKQEHQNAILYEIDTLGTRKFTVDISYDPNNVFLEAHSFLETVLLNYLGNVRETIEATGKGRFERSKTFPCLLPVIYSFLADAVTGTMQYTQCEYCGEPFYQEDSRQRYCPHPDNPRERSLCNNNARKKKYRDKKQERKTS